MNENKKRILISFLIIFAIYGVLIGVMFIPLKTEEKYFNIKTGYTTLVTTRADSSYKEEKNYLSEDFQYFFPINSAHVPDNMIKLYKTRYCMMMRKIYFYKKEKDCYDELCKIVIQKDSDPDKLSNYLSTLKKYQLYID